MFTNIEVIWLMIAFMVAMIIMMCIKIFSDTRPFHFLEHKATYYSIFPFTRESFSGSGNFSGSYAYTYDGPEPQTGDVTTINGMGLSYQDNLQ